MVALKALILVGSIWLPQLPFTGSFLMVEFALFLASMLIGAARGTASMPMSLPPPPTPVVSSLLPESAESVRLTWEETPGFIARVCVSPDRGEQGPESCSWFSQGWADLPVPRADREQVRLTLSSCYPAGDCSEAVDAGVLGRRISGPFDFYATALRRERRVATVAAWSNRPDAALVYHQAAPGRADQRVSGCDLIEGACGAADLRLPGALVGVTQEIPSNDVAALTFQIEPRPTAALIFDDGTGLFSGDRLTAQTILDQYGVKGNFFLIGRAMRDRPSMVRALVSAGHRVGNHTYSHPFLTRLSDAQIGQELDNTEAQYRAIVPNGTTKPCFRAPNGAIDNRVSRIAAGRGYRQIDWTVGSLDWAGVSSDRVLRNVLDGLHDGALISFHTQEPATMTALRTLIPLMQSWGYDFVLVC